MVTQNKCWRLGYNRGSTDLDFSHNSEKKPRINSIFCPALRVTYRNVMSVTLVPMGDLSPALYLRWPTCCHWLHQFVFVLSGRKRLVEGIEMDAKWTLSLLAAILHTGTLSAATSVSGHFFKISSVVKVIWHSDSIFVLIKMINSLINSYMFI